MHRMRVESLNIGLPQREVFGEKEIISGICKRPVDVPLRLTDTGFEGDGVGDTKHHGGRDKAVCVYSLDHYPYWENVLERMLQPPVFGENLSVSHLSEDDVCVGDIFTVGTALVQVSQPRQPCKTLSALHGRNDMARLVVNSGRTGFYFRVLEEGTVKKGDALILREKDLHGVTLSYANRIFHHERKNCEGIMNILAVPALSESWKKSFRELNKKCGSL